MPVKFDFITYSDTNHCSHSYELATTVERFAKLIIGPILCHTDTNSNRPAVHMWGKYDPLNHYTQQECRLYMYTNSAAS